MVKCSLGLLIGRWGYAGKAHKRSVISSWCVRPLWQSTLFHKTTCLWGNWTITLMPNSLKFHNTRCSYLRNIQSAVRCVCAWGLLSLLRSMPAIGVGEHYPFNTFTEPHSIYKWKEENIICHSITGTRTACFPSIFVLLLDPGRLPEGQKANAQWGGSRMLSSWCVRGLRTFGLERLGVGGSTR